MDAGHLTLFGLFKFFPLVSPMKYYLLFQTYNAVAVPRRSKRK